MIRIKEYPEGKLYITDNSAEYREITGKNEKCVFVCNGAETQIPDGVKYTLETFDAEDSYLRRIFCHMSGTAYIVCETERLVVRESTENDVIFLKRIYESIGENEREDVLWSATTFADDLSDEQEKMRSYIENMYGFYDFGLWTVVLKETGEVIGRVGFSFDDGAETPELGFVIGKKWQGNGYAHEAAVAAIEYMREELEINELSAKVSQKNIKSLNMLKRLDGEYGIRVIIV